MVPIITANSNSLATVTSFSSIITTAISSPPSMVSMNPNNNNNNDDDNNKIYLFIHFKSNTNR